MKFTNTPILLFLIPAAVDAAGCNVSKVETGETAAYADPCDDPDFRDGDGDGYVSDACGGDDCDDGAGGVNSAAEEVCNGVDDDCNREADVDVEGTTWYQDRDGDSYGTSEVTAEGGCLPPTGYVERDGDCDDESAYVNPGVREDVTNEVDDDCNGGIDEIYASCDGENSLQEAVDLAESTGLAMPTIYVCDGIVACDVDVRISVEFVAGSGATKASIWSDGCGSPVLSIAGSSGQDVVFHDIWLESNDGGEGGHVGGLQILSAATVSMYDGFILAQNGMFGGAIDMHDEGATVHLYDMQVRDNAPTGKANAGDVFVEGSLYAHGTTFVHSEAGYGSVFLSHGYVYAEAENFWNIYVGSSHALYSMKELGDDGYVCSSSTGRCE